MGAVWMAQHTGLDVPCALKFIHDEAAKSADLRARFEREAKAAAQLRSPNVVQILDHGVWQGSPYIAMELLEGESLAARIERAGALDPTLAVTVAAGICSALGAVHDKKIVHRDVKPSNIFLARRPDGGVDPKLVDFGVAKRTSLPPETVSRVTKRYGERMKTPAPTAANVVVGTPRYLSPEQILGRTVDARSDVWALSATIYEALAGAAPFTGATIAELLERIVVEPPPPLAPRGVPPALERVLMRGLAKEPADRYASAAELSSALWAALAEERRSPVPAPAPVPEVKIPATPYGRWILAAAALVLLAVVAVGFLRRSPPPPPPQPMAAATPAPPEVVPASTAAMPAATNEPEGASVAAPARALPEPRAKGARARNTTADRAPLAPTAAPAASTSFRIDDLKTPY
jgi:serine/threonine-protein kinase